MAVARNHTYRPPLRRGPEGGVRREDFLLQKKKDTLIGSLRSVGLRICRDSYCEERIEASDLKLISNT
ncbi:hypothetical protein EVAR_82985_1 [Eumeta japonica]|uniref:Uncharacterized protein n=1 Tax=Eumeta variegata TaxID=151549 RepID=A0A4C1VT95_EUMVA|nr:hypothetical protein EVAR_82985_1 [Eumeta japonica]